MIVADTSAWIDYVRGIDAPHTNLLDYELDHSRIVTGDLIIATFCIENDFDLLHNDRDFDPMERLLGLRVRR